MQPGLAAGDADEVRVAVEDLAGVVVDTDVLTSQQVVDRAFDDADWPAGGPGVGETFLDTFTADRVRPDEGVGGFV